MKRKTQHYKTKIALLNDGAIAYSGIGVASCKILAYHQQHGAGQHALVILWTGDYDDKVFTTQQWHQRKENYGAS